MMSSKKSKIRIGVLATVQSATISDDLAHEAGRRGHVFDVIKFSPFDLMHWESVFEALHLLSYDVLYYRTSLGASFALLMQEYLVAHGRRAINLSVIEHPFLERKRYQLLRAVQAEVAIPTTLFSFPVADTFELIAQQVGIPFIIKANVSSQGRDVHLIHTACELSQILGAKSGMEYLFQRYVPHACNYRVHVIGRKAVAGYKRVPLRGDFRGNVSQGATMEMLQESEVQSLYPLAERMSTYYTPGIYTFDFLPGDHPNEYLFEEVNMNPGWELSDSAVTGVNMSALVVDYFEQIAVSDISGL